ncbi:MAG: hypothetical protein MUF81_19520, partial [Verrucomicrobia bacterium]|nr:hypothetical protein [Verrucomicrobiota bacterium]
MKIQTIFGVRISQPPFLAFVSRRICQTKRLMILATLVSLACQNSGAQPFATVNFGNKSTCLVTNQLTGNPVNVGDGIKAALYWAELGSTNFVQLFDYY